MALPSRFWLPLAALLIVAPLSASAASWAYAGAASDSKPIQRSVSTWRPRAQPATRRTPIRIPRPARQNQARFMSAPIWRAAKCPCTRKARRSHCTVGRRSADRGHTHPRRGVSPDSTGTLTMSGTMSASGNGFASAWLLIDNVAVGGVCSSPSADLFAVQKIAEPKSRWSAIRSSSVRMSTYPPRRGNGGVCSLCCDKFNWFRRHHRPNLVRVAPWRHIHLALGGVSNPRGQRPRGLDMGNDARRLRGPRLHRLSQNEASRHHPGLNQQAACKYVITGM